MRDRVAKRGAGGTAETGAPITVRIRFGAALRPFSGTAYETIAVPPRGTVGDVLAEVGRIHPGLLSALPSVLPVIGGAQRPPGWPVNQGDEVAILVPIAGG